MRISDWSSDVCSSDLQLVQRAPLLVGGGELKVLELQEHPRAGDFGKGPAFQAWRADNGVADPGRCSLNIGKPHRLFALHIPQRLNRSHVIRPSEQPNALSLSGK